MTNKQDLNQIQSLAYQFWQERGCPAGSPEIDWYRAEQAVFGSMEDNDLTAPEINVDNTDMGSPLEVLSMNLESLEFGNTVADGARTGIDSNVRAKGTKR